VFLLDLWIFSRVISHQFFERGFLRAIEIISQLAQPIEALLRVTRLSA
jgi:hypothetical protein